MWLHCCQMVKTDDNRYKHSDLVALQWGKEASVMPQMRKWADEATKTAVWEVYKFIHVNTVAPFGTFRTKIRKWKKIV